MTWAHPKPVLFLFAYQEIKEYKNNFSPLKKNGGRLELKAK